MVHPRLDLRIQILSRPPADRRVHGEKPADPDDYSTAADRNRREMGRGENSDALISRVGNARRATTHPDVSLRAQRSNPQAGRRLLRRKQRSSQ